MGCEYYWIEKRGFHISDGCDEAPCLCTFPDSDVLFKSDLKGLALLGLATLWVARGELDNHKEQYVTIPYDLPEDLAKKIMDWDFEEDG